MLSFYFIRCVATSASRGARRATSESIALNSRVRYYFVKILVVKRGRGARSDGRGHGRRVAIKKEKNPKKSSKRHGDRDGAGRRGARSLFLPRGLSARPGAPVPTLGVPASLRSMHLFYRYIGGRGSARGRATPPVGRFIYRERCTL